MLCRVITVGTMAQMLCCCFTCHVAGVNNGPADALSVGCVFLSCSTGITDGMSGAVRGGGEVGKPRSLDLRRQKIQKTTSAKKNSQTYTAAPPSEKKAELPTYHKKIDTSSDLTHKIS